MMGFSSQVHDGGNESDIDTVEEIATAFLPLLIPVSYTHLKLSILLDAFFLAGFLGILLQSPDSPQWHVRLLYLSNMNADRLGSFLEPKFKDSMSFLLYQYKS